MADPPSPPPAESQEPANVVRVYDRDLNEHLVSPQEAVSGLRRGIYGMADGDKLTVKEAGDKTRALDAAEAVDAVQSHQFRAASVGEFQDQWYRDQYEGSLAHRALAYGTGLTKQLGLGGGDAALVGLASAFGRGDHVRDLIRDQDRYLSGYRTAGEMTGFVLPALATVGGYGALRGVTAAGRGLAAASGAIERGVVSGLGRMGFAEGLGGIAARGLGAAVGGAAELGVYGAGDAFSRAVVERPGLTAEQALAAMGGGFAHGAVAGGVFGGALGFGGGVLRAGASKAGEAASGAWSRLERLAGRAEGEAAVAAGASPGEAAVERYISLVSRGDAAEASALREAWRDRARLIGKADDVLEGAQRSLRKDVDELLAAERRLTEEATGKLKIEQVKKSVQTGNEAATLEHVGQQLESVRGRVSEMLADAGAYGNRAQLKEAQAIVDSVEKRISHAVGTEAQNAVMFSELDFLKRRLGKFARPGQMVGADSATAGAMRELYEGLRVGLEDAGLWGKAAEQQTAINAAWAKQLESKARFQSDFATAIGRDEIDAWVTKFGSDPAKLASYVNGFGRAANDLRHETLVAHVANTRALAEAIGKNYELPGAKLAEVQRAQAAAERFQKTIGGVEKEVGATNRLKRLQEEEKAHAIGGLTGLAVDVVARPVATMSRVAELEAMAAKVQRKMGDAVQGYLGTAKQVAKDVAGKAVAAAKTTSAVAGRAAKGAVLEFEEHEARKDGNQPVEKRYTSDRERVLSAKVSLPQRQQALAKQLQGTPPAFVQQALATQARAVEHLASKVPAVPQSLNTLQPHLDHSTPPTSEMAAFLRRVQTVEDPASVLESMKRGDITPEQVETLRAVYPEIHAEVQRTIMAEAAKMKEPISFSKAQALNALFPDVALHPALDPAFIAAQQTALTATNPPAEPPRRPLRPSNLAKAYDPNREEPVT
jgi:hypothetical protein